MKFSKIIFSIFLWIAAEAVLYSQNHCPSSSFLPLDHFAYTYIQLLQERHIITGLNVSVKPYKRIDIARTLLQIDTEKISRSEAYWTEQLKKELAFEMNMLADTAAADPFAAASLKATDRMDFSNNHFENDYAWYPEIRLNGPRFSISVRGRIDNGLLHDTAYSGRKTDYFGARIEDAYGLFSSRYVDFSVGRFAEEWSPVTGRSLILSDNAHTYDKICLYLRGRHIAFRSAFARLDEINGANRFFSAHRIDLTFSNNMQIGLSETVLFGGVNQGVELSYLNPFTFYAETQLNQKKEANELLAFDFYIPVKQYNFRGQILIDDFILDGAGSPPPNRKTSPDRLGFLFNAGGYDLFLNHSTLNLTYERVGSYTYNVKRKRPWQAYTFEDKGLGAATNDYDRWTLELKYFPRPGMIHIFDASLDRKGRRSLSSNDFEDPTFVKLPFPSGTVHKTITAGYTLIWTPLSYSEIRAAAHYTRHSNFNHISGNNKDYLNASLRLDYYIDHYVNPI